MAISDDTLEQVREALNSAENLDASRITVEATADEHVVLRGSVSAEHQVDVAATLAQSHAPGVRTLLEVDRGLREDAATSPRAADAPDVGEGRASDGDEPRADDGDEVVRPSRRTTADVDLSTQTSEFRPQAVDDDLTPDEDVALAENLPWDPPDEPHSSPTPSEQRGIVPGEVDTGEPTDVDPDHDDPDPDQAEEPTLSELSAAELARDARHHERGAEDEGNQR